MTKEATASDEGTPKHADNVGDRNMTASVVKVGVLGKGGLSLNAAGLAPLLTGVGLQSHPISRSRP
jgi:hypothetical protein